MDPEEENPLLEDEIFFSPYKGDITFLIEWHNSVSKWLLGPFTLEERGPETKLRLKYPNFEINDQDFNRFLADLSYFQFGAAFIFDDPQLFQLDIYRSDFPIIYFKWNKESEVIWGLDSTFFQSDSLTNFLQSKRIGHIIDPWMLAQGIQNNYEDIRGAFDADRRIVLFFIFLDSRFIDNIVKYYRSIKEDTVVYHALSRHKNFLSTITSAFFTIAELKWRRAEGVDKFSGHAEAETLYHFLEEAKSRRPAPADPMEIIKLLNPPPLVAAKTDWHGDLLSLAQHFHELFGQGKKYKNFKAACVVASQQYLVYDKEVTWIQIYKCYDNYQYKQNSK